MSTELANDSSIWTRNKGGYEVAVEHSAPHGVTTYRRKKPTANGQRRLCSMETARFVKVFTKIASK